jgi:hypothetical protein
MTTTSMSLRFSAVAASLGVLAFGVAAVAGSFNDADARGLGPEVTGGSHPYVSFTGLSPAAISPIYTVPTDRILVVTGAVMSTTANLLQGSTVKVRGNSFAMYGTQTNPGGAMLTQGNGHLVFDPGSVVQIEGAASYYIEGYLAHP